MSRKGYQSQPFMSAIKMLQTNRNHHPYGLYTLLSGIFFYFISIKFLYSINLNNFPWYLFSSLNPKAT
jgi:hypothetical protein